MTKISGRTAIIFGAAKGIGKATAISLAKRNANVVIADIDKEAINKTVEDIQSANGEALGIPCDVAQESSFADIREKTLKRYGKIHIVMNNVGVLASGKPEEIPLREWERLLNVNLMSVVRSQHCFLPDLIAQGEGHIVNTASFAGLFPYAFDRLPYAATKSAIITMSEGLALYVRPKGIGVTCLCPGPVRTQIGETIKFWSEGVELRGPGPEFPMLEADIVGEMVADAIEQNRFFLPTHENVKDKLVARANDFDGFLETQLKGFS